MSDSINVSPKNLHRYDIIKQVIRGELTNSAAAELLHLSKRNFIRLKNKVKKFGINGLAHGNQGKVGHNKVTKSEEEIITNLVQQNYLDFTPTFAAEKLAELHNIKHDPKTITRILVTAGIWQKKKINHKQKQTHRTWRQRRQYYGELIQFDGSYEYWLENRNNTGRMCLLAGIDDASGKITYAKFAAHEGIFPVFNFWQEYLTFHGKPLSIYLDKFSTYNQNQKSKNTTNDTLTQFERAAQELRIELIKANSPQAKGRVERLFKTLQDRLIKELRLNNINTAIEANNFLINTFIPDFNKRFSVQPTKEGNLHRPLSNQEQKQLSSIFSRQEKRVVQNDFTISFNNQYYQLTKASQPVTICKKDTITVEEWTNQTIHLKLRNKELNYQILPQRPPKQNQIPWVIPKTAGDNDSQTILDGYGHPKAHKPSPNHPWRTYLHRPENL